MTSRASATPRIRYGGVVAGQEEIAAVERVLRSQSWACGPKVEEFERRVAEYQGRRHALFVNSGSSALLLALAGSDCLSIAMPAVQFPTAWAAADWCGIQARLVDVDDSLNMDSRRLAELHPDDIDAVLFVHLAGNPTNIAEVRDLCRRNDWVLIEDNCEGFGGMLGDVRVGNFGAISCTSTHAAHQIATGEGGIVFTDDPDVFLEMKRIRDWGRAYGKAEILGYYEHYVFSEIGLNLRNSDIAAALGLVQLKRLPGFVADRQTNYAYLRAQLVDLPVELPRAAAPETASWYTFPLLTDRRDDLREHLERCGIETRTILTGNLARQPMAAELASVAERFPVADRVMREGLWFSVHPRLTQDDLDHIVASVREFFA